MLPQIDYMTHEQTAAQVCSYFPGLQPEDLPGGEGWAIERLTIATHNGTHLDAPYHHHSTMNRGERAITIDEVPLEWCFAPGVKLDFRDLPDGHMVSAAEVEAELDRIGHILQPLDIVVINTAAGAGPVDCQSLLQIHNIVVAGRRRDNLKFEPFRFDQMRPGCYDVNARVADMDVAQAITKPGSKERRVGKCAATFHVTPKAQQRSKGRLK